MLQSTNTNFSDPEWICSLKRRDKLPCEQIVKAYTDHLYKAALGMGLDHNESNELVQATWLSFFESLPKFEGRSHIRTYLFGILYNKFKELLRKKKRHQASEFSDELMDAQMDFDGTGHMNSAPLDPESFQIASEKMDVISQCLDSLPKKQRLAFVLKEVECQSSRGICNILDISITHLGVLMYRAKNKLRICIEKKFKANF